MIVFWTIFETADMCQSFFYTIRIFILNNVENHKGHRFIIPPQKCNVFFFIAHWSKYLGWVVYKNVYAFYAISHLTDLPEESITCFFYDLIMFMEKYVDTTDKIVIFFAYYNNLVDAVWKAKNLVP